MNTWRARQWSFKSAAAFIASLLVISSASATSYRCEVFPAIGGNGSPDAVTTADGSVWYIAGERLVRVKDRKSAGVVAVDASAVRLSGLAVGPDGAVWFSKDKDARIGRMPLDGTAGSEFTVPEGKFIRGIRAGSHELWFYDPVLGFVGSMTPSGAVRRYIGPSQGGAPFDASGLAVAPDGGVWVSIIGHNAVYRLDPTSGQFRRFDIPSPAAQPGALVAAKDGSVWFTMPAVHKIGHVFANGQMTEIDVGKDSPAQLAWGPDGALWYTYPGGSMIGRIDATGAATSFRCGTNSAAMTIGPDGKLWAMGNNEISVVVDDAAPVQAVETRGAPAPLTTAHLGSKVADISIDGLASLLQALPGRTAVQFTSLDPKCGYCLPANDVFDQDSIKYARIHFLRVHFQPWTSVNNFPSSEAYHLTGLPTIIVFDAGKETNRLEGVPADMRLGPTLDGTDH